MSALALNAEALYQELLRGVRSLCQADTRLVGITSGGAWLAERLKELEGRLDKLYKSKEYKKTVQGGVVGIHRCKVAGTSEAHYFV